MLFTEKMSINCILCLAAFSFYINPASAAIVDITVSGLDGQGIDLAAFDLNVSWDDSEDLHYDSHTLTEHLGQFSLYEAEDLSTPYVAGSNNLNLSVISYLHDLDGQPNNFTLASLTFLGDQDPTNNIHLSDIILSDQFGNSIQFEVSGTHISANVSAIPLPGSIWLMGFSLVSIMGFGKKKTGPGRKSR
jgi:hypothetical protein